jgi:hypothetical protein
MDHNTWSRFPSQFPERLKPLIAREILIESLMRSNHQVAHQVKAGDGAFELVEHGLVHLVGIPGGFLKLV